MTSVGNKQLDPRMFATLSKGDSRPFLHSLADDAAGASLARAPGPRHFPLADGNVKEITASRDTLLVSEALEDSGKFGPRSLRHRRQLLQPLKQADVR